jgi:dihydroorotase-like cyclic amidohydrolase
MRLPGLIDVHVHLRDPGSTHKEDFSSGTRAAVAGGFTHVLDMPNNPGASTLTIALLEDKLKRSALAGHCDVGFHFGTDGHNTSTFQAAAANPRVFGLKVYCNHTTGHLLLRDLALLEQVFTAWPSGKPILVHAEQTELAAAIALATLYDQRLHVCHIARAIEVDLVRRGKARGQQITAGVCPHHLYLTEADVSRLHSFAVMKPALGSAVDQEALWAGLEDGTIDVVETDHAPHTREEKAADTARAAAAGDDSEANSYSVYGVPGLETALPLIITAVGAGRLAMERVADLLHANPRRIFNLPEQPDTFIEVDTDTAFELPASGYSSKADWTPFAGMTVYGRVTDVTLRGRQLIADGQWLI